MIFSAPLWNREIYALQEIHRTRAQCIDLSHILKTLGNDTIFISKKLELDGLVLGTAACQRSLELRV